MEIYDILSARRSCRRFDGREIPAEALETIARAATLSPSGLGKNELHFVCLEGNSSQAYLDLTEKLSGIGQYYGGRSIILIVRDKAIDGLYDQDSGAAIQSMYLEAMGLGYGACVLHLARGVFMSDEGRAFQEEVLNLPSDRWQVLESMVFGYPVIKEKPNVADEKRVHVVK